MKSLRKLRLSLSCPSCIFNTTDYRVQSPRYAVCVVGWLLMLLVTLSVTAGALPPTMGKLSQLEFLNLQDNELTGFVPEEFGSLTSLKSLVLSGNRITMPYPPSLSQLTRLMDFHICHWWPSEHHEIHRAFIPLEHHRCVNYATMVL